MLACTPFGPDFFEEETECVGRAIVEIRPKNLLSPRSEEDQSLSTVVLGLVGFGSELPDCTVAIDVLGRHQANFAGSTTAEQLDPHHIGHDTRQEWQRLVDDVFFDGLNRLRLSRFAAALAEPADRLQTMENRRLDHFVLDRPSKRSLDASDLLVDLGTTPTNADHFFADGRQTDGGEFGGGGGTVKFLHDSQRIADMPQLARGFAILE